MWHAMIEGERALQRSGHMVGVPVSTAYSIGV